MDSLNRAKQFITRKASKLALAIVPLAALAVVTPAKASVILDPGQGDVCNTVGLSGSSCTVIQAGTVGGNSGLNWLQLSGQGSGIFTSGSYMLNFSQSGGSANDAVFPGGNVPVSWDFVVSSSGSAAINWTVFFQVGLQTGPSTFDYEDYTLSGSASPGTTVIGSNFIPFSDSGDVVFYKIAVDLSSSSPFTADVPAGSSADLNPIPTAPEPASLWLAAAGGGALLLLGRKKRA
jgi:hypothetical protein